MKTIIVTFVSTDLIDAEWNARCLRALRKWGFRFDPTTEGWIGETPLYPVNRYTLNDFIGYGFLKIIG